jgi:predicted DNA-binding mobile mystery protein A
MNRGLQLKHLNIKMRAIESLRKVVAPPTGWIKAIRLSLGMSARQLGDKLSITRQGVQEMEKREQTGAITIQSLWEAAKALDMQFVYGFIPDDGTLEALIERKARQLATEIVRRTLQSMRNAKSVMGLTLANSDSQTPLNKR